MVKLVSIFSLKPDIDADKAYRVWREKHTPGVKNKLPPGAKRYTINKMVHRYPPAGGGEVRFDIFGYEMIWFDDVKLARESAERLRSAPPDEFLSGLVQTHKMVIIEEENIKL